MLEFEIPFTSNIGDVGVFWSHDIGGHMGGINPGNKCTVGNNLAQHCDSDFINKGCDNG